MNGLMMDWPLLVPSILGRAGPFFRFIRNQRASSALSDPVVAENHGMMGSIVRPASETDLPAIMTRAKRAKKGQAF